MVRVPGRRPQGSGPGSLRLGLVVLWRYLVVELALRMSDLPATCRRVGVDLGRADGAQPLEAPLLDRWRLARLSRFVTFVGERWPCGDTCLRRSLVLGWLLRDLRPHLVVGVKRGGHDTGSPFDVHAWLEIAGHSLDPTAVDYVPLPPSAAVA